MSHILRLPAILALFALMALSLLGALAAAGSITGFVAPIAQVQEVQAAAAESGAAEATWIDVGLLGGATLLFLVSAVRLMRGTQGFWAWLLGFACYGGRWAWAQQESGDLMATIQAIDLNVYRNPQALVTDLSTPEGQVGILALVLVVGLIVFLVDAMDRSRRDKHEPA